MTLILMWVALCVAVGMFAHIRRERNGFGWFVLTMFISPLLGGIFIAILRPRRPIEEERPRTYDFSSLPPREQARLIKFREDLAQR